MTTYFVFIIILMGLAILGIARDYSRFTTTIILSAILIFTSFRNGIGVDTITYQEIFKSVIENDTSSIHAEYGYLLLNKLVAVFSEEYVFVQFLTVCISLFFVYLFIKSNCRICYRSIALIVLLCSTFYLSYFCSGVRQGLAISICLYSSKFVIERKFLKFLLFVFLSMLFHTSAVIFLLAYWMPQKKFKLIYVLLLFIAAYFLAPIVKTIFDIAISQVTGHYMGYATMFNGDANSNSGLGIFVRIIFWLVVFILAYRTIKSDERNKIVILNLFMIGICCYLLNRNVDILNRFNEYYLSFFIVVFTYAIDSFKRNSKVFFCFTSFFIFLSLFISFILFVKDAFVPYKSYFSLL